MLTKSSLCENHPFPPFIPNNAKILMLGTFPPKPNRWSMEFYYPNWINDMWRIMGIIFYDNKDYFCDIPNKSFFLDKIIEFLNEKGIALHDTASQVIRLKDNAADKFLEIVTPVDLEKMVSEIPSLKAIVTTGEKASTTLSEITNSIPPKVGEAVEITINGNKILHYRMPSSSRAYPLSVSKKADIYGNMFSKLGYELFKKNI